MRSWVCNRVQCFLRWSRMTLRTSGFLDRVALWTVVAPKQPLTKGLAPWANKNLIASTFESWSPALVRMSLKSGVSHPPYSPLGWLMSLQDSLYSSTRNLIIGKWSFHMQGVRQTCSCWYMALDSFRTWQEALHSPNYHFDRQHGGENCDNRVWGQLHCSPYCRF